MYADLIAYIDTDRLRHNVRALRALCGPGVRFCAPLKADAYGHGLSAVAPVVYEEGADFAAVATLQEAIDLRALGWMRPILVLGNVLAVPNAAERRERLNVLFEHGLAMTLCNTDVIRLINDAQFDRPIDAHLKLDTGMGRMGVLPGEMPGLLDAAMGCPGVRVAGLYSHFATADFADMSIVDAQLVVLRDCLRALRSRLPPDVLIHTANSAATISRPDAHFDMVRPGLALYGYSPADHLGALIDLRPILRVVSHLTAVKNLPTGHGVGYAHTFVTRRPTRLGIVPAGYFDGFVRTLSNAAIVGTPAGDAPVIGRISMDQLAVDLTELPPLPVGTEITLIDDRPERPNSVASLAQRIGTIPYEVTCLLGPRAERRPIQISTTSESPAVTKPHLSHRPMCTTV